MRIDRRSEMQQRRVVLTLCAVVVAGILVRVIPAWDRVFVDGQVWLQGNDAWYHMRLAQNVAHNWPSFFLFDYYTYWPYGYEVISGPLMRWLIAAGGIIASGGGVPSDHTLLLSGAFLPVGLAALTVIPVYFIGKEMAGRWAGVMAAGLVTLLPSEFMHRSKLGFCDQHVLEVLAASCVILFLLLAYRRRQWRWYIAAGVALGVYFLSWHAAVLLLFIIWVWGILQIFIDHYRGEDWGLLSLGLPVMAGIALLLYLPFFVAVPVRPVFVLALLAVVATGPAILLVSHVARGKVALPATCVALGGGLLFVAWLVEPVMVEREVLYLFLYAWPQTGIRTIAETLPMSPERLMHEYGVNVIFGLGGVVLAVKQRLRPMLLGIWFVSMFALTLNQWRWDYYLVVPLSLLSVYFFVNIGKYLRRDVREGLSLVVCVALLFATAPGSVTLNRAPNLITQDWYNSLVWMRENTPEPYADADAYYRQDLEEPPEYGVLSWWDYGHWITAVGRRVPVSNPFQQAATETALFLIHGGELPEGIHYIVVDDAMLTRKLHAIGVWSESGGGEPMPAREDIHMVKLVEGRLPGYQLVYDSPTVCIWEVPHG